MLLMGDDKGRTGKRHTTATTFLVPAIVFAHDERIVVVLQLAVQVYIEQLPSFGTHNCMHMPTKVRHWVI